MYIFTNIGPNKIIPYMEPMAEIKGPLEETQIAGKPHIELDNFNGFPILIFPETNS